MDELQRGRTDKHSREDVTMTNIEKIKSMSIDEMAEFIYNVSENETEITVCKNECDWCTNDVEMCQALIGRWLQEESEEQMNGLKSKLDDLLDELEHCCVCQHSEIADDIRAKIHKLVEDRIKEK